MKARHEFHEFARNITERGADYGGIEDEAFSHAIRDDIFLDMEADFWLWPQWRRGEERAEFLVDVTESAIVDQEGLVNFGEAPEDGDVGGEILAHFYEGADDVEAHGHGARTVQDRGSHQCAMFREGVGKVLTVLSASGL
jgi:hypothetical protein